MLPNLIALVECSWRPWTWGQCIVDMVTAVIGLAIDGLILLIFTPIVDMISKAVNAIMVTMGTFWMDPKIIRTAITTNPDCTDGGGSNPCGQASAEIAFINDQLMPVVAGVAVVSVIIAGARMAFTHRGEPVRELLKSLLTLTIVSTAGIAFVSLLISAGDSFSTEVVNAAVADGKFGDAVANMIMAGLVVGSPAGLALAIILGILAIIGSLVQIVLLIVRNGMLVLLMGIFPLAAAFTNTEMGKAWFKRVITWLTAFLLYKPVAALIYATAIKMVSTAGVKKPWEYENLGEVGPAVVQAVTGLMMIFLALFALPALMRFLTPLVAATAGGPGLGSMMGGVAGKAADKMAEGADSGGGGGGGGPSGSVNPGQGQRSGQSQPSGGRPPSSGGPSGSTNAPSSGPPPSSASTASSGASSGAAGGASGGAAGGAAGGASGGAAAGGGAAAAAGPAAIAVVAIMAAKKVADTAKQAADGAVASGADDAAMDEGPSGSN
ncbi:hypothetical protein OG394_26710 [Kribbella sp. NBC_01245]|uniref:hypothetical protein n=1 Tax=Kribbella sp. NBC_01245 TaxID=2903578 RepID=UPI002E29D973|nr:hypothetical protein [Kribbella sp. NBC_01245]